MSSRSLIKRPITALFNGVSQQPETLRLPSQAESQVNMLSTVVDGVRKRPGSQWIETIDAAVSGLDDSKFHIINRDSDSQYLLMLPGNGVGRVFDLADGSEETVNYPYMSAWANNTAYAVDDVVYPSTRAGHIYRCTVAGTSGGTEPTWGILADYATKTDNTVTWEAVPDYLFTTTPQTSFSLVTVADFTFIVNKQRLVYEDDLPTAEPGNIGERYRMPRRWRNRYGAGTYYNANGNDALDGTVQVFSDLPGTPSANDYYKVVGNDDSNFGGYYVRWNATDSVWEETFGEGANTQLDELTMPHVLVDNQDGTFSVRPFKWLPRQFGDEETNPAPTFVGGYINEVFFYKNRLGLLSDENIVFSGAGDFGNFFRNTVTTLIDSDVVDVAVSGTQVNKLKHAVPFNNGLMLFSDKAQFSMNVTDILTPTSVSVDQVTRYDIDPEVEPIGLNSEAYFVTRNGNYSRIREYYVDGDSNNTEAADITAHVPEYLPANLRMITGSSNEDMLVALPETDGTQDNILYVYKFRWQGDEKVMSSWSKWEFSAQMKILFAGFVENELYIVHVTTGGYQLEKLDLESGAVAGSLTHDLLLDRRTLITTADMSYDGGTNITTVTLPYSVPTADRAEFYFIYADRTDYEGVIVLAPASQLSWNSVTEVEFVQQGDFTSYDMFVGVNYDSEYEFSQLFNADGNGVAITTGRLQVRTMTVYYKDANFFGTEVDPYGKNSPTLEDVHPEYLWSFAGKTLGDGGLTLNTPAFNEGRYTFSVGGDSRDISIKMVNNYPYQAKFTSAEWEALYFNRAR